MSIDRYGQPHGVDRWFPLAFWRNALRRMFSR